MRSEAVSVCQNDRFYFIARNRIAATFVKKQRKYYEALYSVSNDDRSIDCVFLLAGGENTIVS